ncbi:MAG TPA: alpha/beta hydrolase [Acidimicrobiales bacterium]|nr:alpha/beta hydrolase [Acidimicrobiales bacterium]
MALIVSGAIGYQRLGERRDRRRYPPPGRRTSVDGRSLHWVDHGGSGIPIMIETGAGSLATGWSGIVSDMAGCGHVYSYDRAGMGWSDPGPLRPSPSAAADDLAAAIASTGEPGPWILIGHSLGGIYARLFQRRHPEVVAGMVLVDSSHEEMLGRIRAEVGSWAVAAQVGLGLAMAAAPRSLGRLLVDTGLGRKPMARLVGGDSPAEQRRQAALYLTSAFRRAQLAELLAVPSYLAELRNGNRHLGSLPVAVVTAADPSTGSRSPMARFRPAWVAMQDDLTSLSTRSARLTATTGGHYVHLDDPKTVLAGLEWVIDRLAESPR